MKTRIVPASELSPKTLRARDYIKKPLSVHKAMAWSWAAELLKDRLADDRARGIKHEHWDACAEHIRKVIIPSMHRKADIIDRNRKSK